MADLVFCDNIFDNVHGYIRLTKVEREIMFSGVFQRLRHVKQLGLANLVFPGAEHTRFAHSLGVLHIVNQLSSAPGMAELSPTERQLLRLGALLHDIGHFPLSHAIEEVLTDAQKAKEVAENQRWARSWAHDLLDEAPVVPKSKLPQGGKLHESLGQTIIQETEIKDILERHNVNPLRVASVAMGIRPDDEGADDPVLGALSQLLHSQVDADRIDYLLRDSVFSGVEGGGFDLPKLYQEARWKDGCFAFDIKGLRAVEQFLLARLSNYRTVVFNRHVQAFEEMAKDVYRAMLDHQMVPNYDQIEDLVRKQAKKPRSVKHWVGFNDHYLFHMIHEVAHDRDVDEITRRKARDIVMGKPMSEVVCEEIFGSEAELQELPERSPIPSKNDQQRINEIAEAAHVKPDELKVVESSFRVLGGSGTTPIQVVQEGRLLKLDQMRETILRDVAGKTLYLRRLYCLDDSRTDAVRGVLEGLGKSA